MAMRNPERVPAFMKTRRFVVGAALVPFVLAYLLFVLLEVSREYALGAAGAVGPETAAYADAWRPWRCDLSTTQLGSVVESSEATEPPPWYSRDPVSDAAYVSVSYWDPIQALLGGQLTAGDQGYWVWAGRADLALEGTHSKPGTVEASFASAALRNR